MLLCAVLPGDAIPYCSPVSSYQRSQSSRRTLSCPARPAGSLASPPLPQLQKTPLPCAASPADLVGSEQEEQEGGLEGAAVCVQPGAAAGQVTWSTGGDCLPHGGSGVSGCGPGLVGAGGSDLVGAGGPHLVGTGGPDLVGAGGPGLEGMEGPDLVGAGAPDLVGAGGRNLTWWEQVDLTWWEWGDLTWWEWG